MVRHALMGHVKVAPAEQVCAPMDSRGLPNDLVHRLRRHGVSENNDGLRGSFHGGIVRSLAFASNVWERGVDAFLGEWSDAVDRFEAEMALFQAGKAPVLVCTGGWVPWSPGARPEGEVLAERAVVLGVPRSHRLVTNKIANTADEARAVALQLRELPSTSANAPIILVTSALHMRRARVLCTRAGFQVVPFPVDVQVSVGRACTMLDLLPEADSLSKTATALREWYGWLFYHLVGRCTEAGSMPGGCAPVLEVQDDAHHRRRTAAMLLAAEEVTRCRAAANRPDGPGSGWCMRTGTPVPVRRWCTSQGTG